MQRSHLQKVAEKRLEMGFIDFRSSDPLLCVGWKDKRLVYVLSTIHLLQVEDRYSEVKRHKGHERVMVQCPHAADDYVKYMRSGQG